MINYTKEFEIQTNELERRLAATESRKEYVKKFAEYLNDANNRMEYKNVLLRVLQRKYGTTLSAKEICKKVSETTKEVAKPQSFQKSYINQFLAPKDKEGEKSISRPQSRESVFVLGIVLELDMEAVIELITKGLWEQGIIYSNYKDIIGVYCIQNGKDYDAYVHMIDKFEAEVEHLGVSENPVETKYIIQTLESNLSDEEFINYLIRNASSFKGYSKTAFDTFYSLWDKAKDIITEQAVKTYRDALWDKLNDLPREKVNELKKFAKDYVNLMLNYANEMNYLSGVFKKHKTDNLRKAIEVQKKEFREEYNIIERNFLESPKDRLQEYVRFLVDKKMVKEKDVEKILEKYTDKPQDYVKEGKKQCDKYFKEYEERTYAKHSLKLWGNIRENINISSQKENFDDVFLYMQNELKLSDEEMAKIEREFEKVRRTNYDVSKSEKNMDYGPVIYKVKDEYKRHVGEIDADLQEDIYNAFPSYDTAAILRLMNRDLMKEKEPDEKKKRDPLVVTTKNIINSIPKEIFNMAISESRMCNLLNGQQIYRDYCAALEEYVKTKDKDAKAKLDKEKKRLIIPTRKDILLLTYFLTVLLENDKDSDEQWKYDFVIDEAFEDMANDNLRKAGYQGIYNGSIVDVLLLTSLKMEYMQEEYEVANPAGYAEMVKYALGFEIEE